MAAGKEPPSIPVALFWVLSTYISDPPGNYNECAFINLTCASTATRRRLLVTHVLTGQLTMKIISTLSALILVFLLPHVSPAVADAPLTEEQALELLVSQIRKDSLYDSWTTLSCLSFMTEGKSKGYFIFSVHEKHGGKCPGDPNTYPTVDRFRVNRLTHNIQWNEPIEDRWLPYKFVLKDRLKN